MRWCYYYIKTDLICQGILQKVLKIILRASKGWIIFMTFGEKLRKYRKEKKLTQKQLADIVGVAATTIVNYENGTTYPQDRKVYSKLADALGIDADFLHNENDVFIDAVREDYGNRGRRQAEKLIADAGALFAGGDLDEDEKQGVLNALQEAFYECKRLNAEKYNPYKNKKK